MTRETIPCGNVSVGSCSPKLYSQSDGSVSMRCRRLPDSPPRSPSVGATIGDATGDDRRRRCDAATPPSPPSSSREVMSSISLVTAPPLPPPTTTVPGGMMRGRSTIVDVVADDDDDGKDDCQSFIRSACQSSNWRSGLAAGTSRVEWRAVAAAVEDDDDAAVTAAASGGAKARAACGEDARYSSRGNAVGENLVMVVIDCAMYPVSLPLDEMSNDKVEIEA